MSIALAAGLLITGAPGGRTSEESEITTVMNSGADIAVPFNLLSMATVKYSFGSTPELVSMGMVMTPECAPSGMVKVAEGAPKSDPSAAVPLITNTDTSTSPL